MIGTTIGQYRVVELLGSGSMGVVYKAVDDTLDRHVAIKILNPELAGDDLMRRFRTEAIALAKLNHPEIATIYELLPSDQSVVMVMEMVRGESLDKVLERAGSLPLDTVAYVVDRVLSALGQAHEVGIVHRDIKPANVMLTESGGVKVMDFGIAFMRGEQASATGGFFGTPGYMPPEQIVGDDVDGRSDLYAVGAIFYRLLTGAYPFQGETIEDMLRAQLSDLPITPLNQYRSGLPSWCERIVRRALAKSPSDRFQTAAEFRSALKQATRLVPERTARLSLSTLGRLGVSHQKVLAGISKASATVALPKPRVARKRVVVAGAAIGVVVIGLAAWRFASARDSNTNAPHRTVPSTPVPVAVAPSVLPSTTTAENSAQSPAMTPPSPENPEPPRRKSARLRATSSKPAAAPLAGAGALNAPSPPAAPIASPTASDPVPAAAAFPPVVFDAKALVGAGDRINEREVNVQMADGHLAVTAAMAPGDVIYRQAYDAIQSIAYSMSRHPLWLSPDGPAPAVRTGRVLGIFSRSRHWVTVRGGDAALPSTLVLRFETAEQVTPVVRAFAERTGRTAVRVMEPKPPK